MRSAISLLGVYFSDTIRSEVYPPYERNCKIKPKIQSESTVWQSILRPERDSQFSLLGLMVAACLWALEPLS